MGSAATACHTAAFCPSTERPFCAYRANPKVNCSRHTFLRLPTILSQEFSPLLQGAVFYWHMSVYTEPHSSLHGPALSLLAEQLDGSPAWISQDGTGAQQSLPRVHQHLWQPQVIRFVCLLRACQGTHARSLSTSEHHQAPGNFWNSADTHSPCRPGH